MKHVLKPISLALISLFLTAGIAQARLEPKQYSGFLGDYSRLEAGPKEGVARRYIKPGVDFKKYKKVMLDHVVFYFRADAKNKGIDADEMKELADKFHRAVIDALGDAYPLVGVPDPDVMRVRVAITDMELPNRGLNTITTIIPAGLLISTVKRGATGKGSFVGEISMEFEVLDAATNKRIAAGVDRRAGGKMDSMSKFGTAEDAFKFWAQRLRAWLDEVHAQ